jgi:hypothetical protein
MRGLIGVAAIVWFASAVYFLLSWDRTPDSFLAWATMVIFVGGIVLAVLGAIFALVAGVWSGHQEKKQWE